MYVTLYYNTVGKARLLRSIINFNKMLNDRDILCIQYFIPKPLAANRVHGENAILTIFHRDGNYHYFIILVFNFILSLSAW